MGGMLYWAVVFFVISLLSAIFGFGIQNGASGVGKILFLVFLVLAAVSVIFGRVDRR